MNTRHEPPSAGPERADEAAFMAGLRAGIRSHDLHVQAAVWLLLGHDLWPRRPEFATVCRRRGGVWWVDWTAARTAFHAGVFDTASSTERAVLDLAIALGEDRYRFSRMGAANALAIVDAVQRALGGPR